MWKRDSSKAGISVPASKRCCKDPAQHEHENSLAFPAKSASPPGRWQLMAGTELQAAVGWPRAVAASLQAGCSSSLGLSLPVSADKK